VHAQHFGYFGLINSLLAWHQFVGVNGEKRNVFGLFFVEKDEKTCN